MDWFTLADVTWVGVVVAVLAAFTVSFIWYHPRAFGTLWARGVGYEDDSDLSGLRRSRAIASVLVFAGTAVVLNVLMAELLIVSIVGGLMFGAFFALVFRLIWWAMSNVGEGRPATLTVIDGIHDVVALAILGGVLAAFL